MRPGRRAAAVGLALGATALGAGSAAARVLAPWGSNLQAPATLDLANGATHATRGRGVRPAVLPNPHDGADLVVFDTRLPTGTAAAPRGGQVLAVRIKGCTVQERTSPTQDPGGIPVNGFDLQTVGGASGGGYRAGVVSPGFRLPFCSQSIDPSHGRISTSTVSTFHPLHMCLRPGQTVAFYSTGGFVPSTRGFPWYPQGANFQILSPLAGADMASFTDADLSRGSYAPGVHPRGGRTGLAQEPGQELLLQVQEGVGADAYGLCPGGTANEPRNSNRVVCVLHGQGPVDGHRRC